MKKRVFIATFIIFSFLFAILLRLAQIQLIDTESFSSHNVNLLEASVQQRTQTWIVNNGRGTIVDRNGETITHELKPTLVLFPFVRNERSKLKEVAKITDIPYGSLSSQLQEADKPFMLHINDQPYVLTTLQMKKINKLKIPGVFAIEQQIAVRPVAEHLIGLTRQNAKAIENRYPEKIKGGTISTDTKIGITGLQRAFDEFLLSEGESRLLYHVDNIGNPLFGLNVKYSAPSNPFYPATLQTTLDKDMQKLAEKVVESHGMKRGGLVLLDVQSSDILAIVSKPSINFNNPFGDEGGTNYMLKSQFPGSVFKIVTAAAAIEKNVPLRGRQFNCDFDLYGEDKADRELGMLDFRESFAQSCNYTFATLAKEMVKKNETIIEDYAAKLGLLGGVVWQGDVFHYEDFVQIPGVDPGKVWGNDNDRYVDKAIAQTAIGQKEVKVTPLAIANMVATIARGGDKKMVRAVKAIKYKNGSVLYSFPQKSINTEQISTYAAEKLQSLMREVVQSGTGRSLNSLPYEVAGKSGTAETGQGNLINKWFTGFFPADNPKYALVVVDIEQPYSNITALDVFADMVEGLYELDNSSNP